MLLFQQIEELTYSHSDSSANIGDFLLKEQGHVQHYSMQQIADAAFTSKSSLVRFAKTLGYSGWKEFQEAFLNECHYMESHYTDIDPNFPFQEGDDVQDIIMKISNLEVESILDTTDQLQPRQVERAVDLMEKSKTIAVFGMSPNTLVARLFRRKMLTIGRNVQIFDSDQGLLANSLGAGDCAILVSYSGNNEKRAPLNFLPTLKSNGVSIIAITGLGDNDLRHNASIVLSMSSRERLYSKISTYSTEESLNFIFNILYSCYFARNYQKNMDYKIDKSKKLEARYSSYSDIKETEASGKTEN